MRLVEFGDQLFRVIHLSCLIYLPLLRTRSCTLWGGAIALRLLLAAVMALLGQLYAHRYPSD